MNHDGAGKLEGFAYGANIGWINFTNRDANGATFAGPKVHLVTGRLSGFIYGANVGWISLSNAFAFVQTDSIQMGPDTDGDGLPDNWEREQAGNLTALTGNGDNDGDGHSNALEYLADTDPLDASSQLRITMYSATAAGSSDTVTWTSRPTRLYHIQKRSDLNVGFLWTDIGLGLIPPNAGLTTTRMFADPLSTQRFFRIEAVKPLSP